jgi:hypothetical protein
MFFFLKKVSVRNSNPGSYVYIIWYFYQLSWTYGDNTKLYNFFFTKTLSYTTQLICIFCSTNKKCATLEQLTYCKKVISILIYFKENAN